MAVKQASIENEYAKDTQLKPEDVELLKNWMGKQHHLPKISDLQVILFLQSCYYSVEKTKTCIEKYYSIKYHVPELFKNRSYADIRKNAQASVVAPLPGFERNFVLIYKLVDSSMNDFDINSLPKLLDMANSLIYFENGSYESHITILDVKGVSISHVLKTNLIYIKKCLVYLQEAVPIRLKNVHILNTTSAFTKLINLVKPFIKAELMNMIIFHENLESLYRYVPQKHLPKEYGGEAPNFQELHMTMLESFKANEKFFADEQLLVSDESKRINKSEFAADQLFGMDGTFKKLSID